MTATPATPSGPPLIPYLPSGRVMPPGAPLPLGIMPNFGMAMPVGDPPVMCVVHGKHRSARNMIRSESGEYRCQPTSQCRMERGCPGRKFKSPLMGPKGVPPGIPGMGMRTQQHNTSCNMSLTANLKVNAYQWNPYMGDRGNREYVEVSRPHFQRSSRISQEPKFDATVSSAESACSSQVDETLGDTTTSVPGLSHSLTPPVSPGPVTIHVSNGPFPCKPLQQAAYPQQQQQPGNARGLELVQILRTQPNEAARCDKMRELTQQDLSCLFDVLKTDPELVTTLCRADRGDVIVHLFDVAEPQFFKAQLDALFVTLTSIFHVLIRDKPGALALTRLYDNVSHSSHYRHALNSLIASDVKSIACNPHGNFLVSQLMKNLTTATQELRARVSSVFCDPSQFLEICTNKFGSHTAEVWARHAPVENFCLTIRRLVTSKGAVRYLASDPFGNNPLQRLMLRMFQGQACDSKQDESECGKLWMDSLAMILTQIQGCEYESKVIAALNGRARSQLRSAWY